MKKNIIVLLFSILFAFCIAEMSVRCFDLSPTIAPLRIGHFKLSDNPLLRFELLKNQKAYESENAPGYIFLDGMNWGSFHTNSFGFRDIERSVEKPDDVIRIAVLGDSITMAINLNVKKRYTELLEKKLNNLIYNEKKYEVMNFGVSGYDMLQEAIILDRDVLQFSPDIVIFGYCLNDDNTLSDGGALRYLLKQQTGKNRSWAHRQINDYKKPFKRLIYKSELAKLFIFAMTASQEMRGQLIDIKAEESRNILDEACFRISNTKKKYGFNVLIVFFPAFDRLSKYAYWPIHLRIKQKAKQNRLPFLDLHGYYLKCARDDGKEFRDTTHDKIHPNARGHKIASDAIAKFLKMHFLRNRQHVSQN